MAPARRRKEVPGRVCSCVRRRAEGQGLAEYAVILALIALALIAALIVLGTDFSGVLSDLGELIDRVW
jgi:Flp pilus assembly pilin Flp